jgi:GNAT superfamily N-acetyltransferase
MNFSFVTYVEQIPCSSSDGNTTSLRTLIATGRIGQARIGSCTIGAIAWESQALTVGAHRQEQGTIFPVELFFKETHFVEGIEIMHSGAKERTWLSDKQEVSTIAHSTCLLLEVMMNIRLVYEPHASEALREFVREGLALYNVAATGVAEYYPVCLFLKNEHQEVLGGLLGHIWAQCMHIATLWVAPILRHQGHGTALLQAAEQLAAERACTLVTLETLSFQAPGFYAKHGYETFAVLPGYPPGHQKHFLKKSIPTQSRPVQEGGAP